MPDQPARPAMTMREIRLALGHQVEPARTAARQTTGQDDTEQPGCGHCGGPHPWTDCAEYAELMRRTGGQAPAPAVGQPAEAHDTDARPPRVQWRVEGYDADEWNPVSRTFSTSEDAHARKRVSRRYPDMPTRVVRETTTWTVEDER